jgi:DnaK suppressor protein
VPDGAIEVSTDHGPDAPAPRPGRPPSATTLHDARDRAARRVEELTEILAGIVDASTNANLDDEHDPEGATVAFEREQTAALLERAHAQLTDFDAALARVATGTYGTCEQCGAPIPAERLEAQPATRTCVGCASEPQPRKTQPRD